MNNEKLTTWLDGQVSLGARIVLVEMFASYIVIGIVRMEKLLVSFKRDASATDQIIGVGFKLVADTAEQSTAIDQLTNEQSIKNQEHIAFPLGSYRGPIELFVRGSKHSTRVFAFHV